MIEGKDLKLSNYVLYHGEIKQIHGINIHGDVSLNLYADKYRSEDLDPILLTPEILRKCGFLNGNGSRYFIPRKGAFGFEITFIGNKACCQVQDYFVEKEFLHELQNLVLDITKEELIYATT